MVSSQDFYEIVKRAFEGSGISVRKAPERAEDEDMMKFEVVFNAYKPTEGDE